VVTRAPDRWLQAYAGALERAWTAVRPLWEDAAELLDAEARRVGLACLQVAFDPAPPDRRPWLALGRAGLAAELRGGVALSPALVVTPVIGGRHAHFVRRRAGEVGYLGYPLPGARRLTAEPRQAPLDELRQLLGGPRAELVQRVTEPHTAGGLAEAMHLAPSAITHHVSTLEQCGLVTRERHGRHVLIRLTERGVALLELYGARELTRV
jgi:DNA-binding transcriptional ArsR family regulator